MPQNTSTIGIFFSSIFFLLSKTKDVFEIDVTYPSPDNGFLKSSEWACCNSLEETDKIFAIESKKCLFGINSPLSHLLNLEIGTSAFTASSFCVNFEYVLKLRISFLIDGCVDK